MSVESKKKFFHKNSENSRNSYFLLKPRKRNVSFQLKILICLLAEEDRGNKNIQIVDL